MPMTNYMSPGGLAPKTGYAPTGFLGGMMWDQERGDYNDMMQLQKLLSSMEAQKQAEELTMGAPLRREQRLADIAKAQATQQTAIPGAQADLGTKQYDLRMKLGTEQSDMATKLAKNALERGQAGTKELSNAYQFALLSRPILQNGGPTAVNSLRELGQRMGVSPALSEALLQNPDQLIPVLLQANPEHRAELAKQKAKSEADYKQHIDVAERQGAAQRDVAQIHAAAVRDAASMRASANRPMSQTQLASQLMQSMLEDAQAGRPVDLAKQKALQEIWSQEQARAAASAAQGQQPGASMGIHSSPTPPTAPPVNLPNGTQPQSQVPKYNIGQKVPVPGHGEVEIIGVNSDGSYRVKKGTREGTWRP